MSECVERIRIPLSIPSDYWMTSNMRLHHMVKANRTKWIREFAALHAKDFPKVEFPCEIEAIIGYSTARKADPPNAWPTVKAAIDGLVDAGIIPDDNSSIVVRHSFTRQSQKSPKGTYDVILVLTMV